MNAEGLAILEVLALKRSCLIPFLICLLVDGEGVDEAGHGDGVEDEDDGIELLIPLICDTLFW